MVSSSARARRLAAISRLYLTDYDDDEDDNSDDKKDDDDIGESGDDNEGQNANEERNDDAKPWQGRS